MGGQGGCWKYVKVVNSEGSTINKGKVAYKNKE